MKQDYDGPFNSYSPNASNKILMIISLHAFTKCMPQDLHDDLYDLHTSQINVLRSLRILPLVSGILTHVQCSSPSSPTPMCTSHNSPALICTSRKSPSLMHSSHDSPSIMCSWHEPHQFIRNCNEFAQRMYSLCTLSSLLCLCAAYMNLY